MKNRFLTMLLCIVMALSLLPAMAFAATVSVSSQEELAAVMANLGSEPTTIELADGTYTPFEIPMTNKNITFKGSKNAVIDNKDMKYLMIQTLGSEFAFDGVTVEFSDNNDGYQGIKDIQKITYKDCTINGTQFLYAKTAKFTGCTFNSPKGYSVRTHSANDVTFTDCTFYTGGRAILLYCDGPVETKVTLTRCTFYDDGTYTKGPKAVVETGNNPNPPAGTSKFTIIINDCTIEQGFEANNSDTPFVGNKDDMDAEHFVVNIAGGGAGAGANVNLPKTGDTSNLTLCLAALLASMAGFALLRRRVA